MSEREIKNDKFVLRQLAYDIASLNSQKQMHLENTEKLVRGPLGSIDEQLHIVQSELMIGRMTIALREKLKQFKKRGPVQLDV